ncbi:glycosyltransferase [Myxococcota bacterium]|nr:glycosyltransferase [Myxococcota bacterium]
MTELLLLGGHALLVATLSLTGLHRLWLTAAYWRTRHQVTARVALDEAALPVVTVQLPVYNERYVVTRLIDAAAALDWPRDRLELQILDDSDDDTTALAEAAAARHRARGLNVAVLRRPDRQGFKAGALAWGLERARGSIIAIFDADFVPPADFLRRAVPALGPEVGMVQARWTHLNEGESWLTRVEAMLLDGHFVIEHAARARSGRWFNFNGTAGLWRREAIVAAGGWQGDTLTEDLDLSYRAQLVGWRFVYLPELAVPAELPGDILAFKGQQRRWAKGSIQTAKKLLPRLWGSAAPWSVKLEATAHLCANLAYPGVLLLSVITPVAALQRVGHPLVEPLHALFFTIAALSLGLFYGVSAGAHHTDWPRRLGRVPWAMALGAGMAVNQSRAVFEALFGEVGAFVRTPKRGGPGGAGRYTLAGDGNAAWEITLGLAQLVGAVACLRAGSWGSAPLLALFGLGYLWVGLGSLSPPSPAPLEAAEAEAAG